MSERTRTYTWSEPVAFDASGEASGLTYLQAMVEGRLPQPPIGATLGFRLVEVGKGHAVFEGEASEFVLNPLGVVHGGLALTLVDSATGCAVQTMLPDGVGYTTLETKANFVRPIRTRLRDAPRDRARRPRRAVDGHGGRPDRGRLGAPLRARHEHAPHPRATARGRSVDSVA